MSNTPGTMGPPKPFSKELPPELCYESRLVEDAGGEEKGSWKAAASCREPSRQDGGLERKNK